MLDSPLSHRVTCVMLFLTEPRGSAKQIIEQNFKASDRPTALTCRVSSVQCWISAKLNTRILCQPWYSTLVGKVWTHRAMPDCSNHHGDELCTKADSNGIHRAECPTRAQELVSHNVTVPFSQLFSSVVKFRVVTWNSDVFFACNRVLAPDYG